MEKCHYAQLQTKEQLHVTNNKQNRALFLGLNGRKDITTPMHVHFQTGQRKGEQNKCLLTINGGKFVHNTHYPGTHSFKGLAMAEHNTHSQYTARACTHTHTHTRTYTMALAVVPKRCPPRVKSAAHVVKVLVSRVPCISLSATVTTCTNNLGCLIQTS